MTPDLGFGEAGETLHLFSRGAVDFIVGAVAVSVVIALVSAALEDAYRPRFQRDAVSAFFFERKFRHEKNLEGDLRDPDGWSRFLDLAFVALPPSVFFLPPDQLCAQLIRHFQAFAFRPDPRAPEPHLEFSRIRPELLSLGEVPYFSERLDRLVDELQSLLLRRASVRAHYFAGSTALAFGVLLWILIIQEVRLSVTSGTFLEVGQWLLLTLGMGGVASLLSPLIQGLISRLNASH